MPRVGFELVTSLGARRVLGVGLFLFLVVVCLS
jgi:hypothetical protein